MLIKCPECGGSVSDKAPACIHCGFPLSNIHKENICLVDGQEYDMTPFKELYDTLSKEAQKGFYKKNIEKFGDPRAYVKISYPESFHYNLYRPQLPILRIQHCRYSRSIQNSSLSKMRINVGNNPGERLQSYVGNAGINQKEEPVSEVRLYLVAGCGEMKMSRRCLHELSSPDSQSSGRS